MHNWRQFILGIVMVASLAGCQQKTAPAPQTSHKSSHVARVTTTKLSWSAAKADKLATFMGEFGVKMRQNYTAVTAKTSTVWNDIDLSAYIAAGKRVQFAGQPTKVNWLPKAKAGSATAANIVAVYADDADKILYLFEVRPDGQARVWVSQTGLQDGLLAVKQTANTDLARGFKRIVAGQDATMAAASSTASASDSRATPAATHAVVFDRSYRHTWYGYIADDDKMHTLTFTANGVSIDGRNATPVYPESERTAADRAALADPGEHKPDQAKMDWGVARAFTYQGHAWINVQGWYQGAGDGTYYRIATRTIAGKAQPVLEEASGAEIWVDGNYYLSADLAAAHRDEVYPDEHQRDD